MSLAGIASLGMMTCPGHGSLGAIVADAAGNAIAAVPWGTCGAGQAGNAGVQLYGIAADGTASTLADVGPGNGLQEMGTTTPYFSIDVAGAGNWFVEAVGFGSSRYGYTNTVATLGQGAFGPNESDGVTMDPAGNSFVILDSSTLNPSAVEKFDPTGAAVWTVQTPQSSPSDALGIAYKCFTHAAHCPAIVVPDELGGAVVPGWNDSSAYDYGCGALTGAFLMRIGASGQCVWSKAAPAQPFPGALFANASGLFAAGGGAVYVTGAYQGSFDYFGCPTLTSSAPTASYLLKLDGCGSCVWAKSFDTSAVSVIPSTTYDLLLATTFNGSLDLGGGTLTSVGVADLAITRLTPAGTSVWSRSFGGSGATVSFGTATPDAVGGAAAFVTVSGGNVDFGGGAVTGGALFKLEDTGTFGWQQAGFASTSYFASDPCGAVFTASNCASCAPGGAQGFTVQKLAP